jgi:2-methylcitrate dehydratase PrpD
MAALLAARGFTCSDTMIEGPKGFGASYARHANFDAALANLGSKFETATLAYKPYPCGFVIHAGIDACLDIARSSSFDAAQVERIELTVSPLAAQLADRPDPRNRNQTIVSLQHWAAAALLYRVAGVAQMSEAAVHEPALAALRRKITLVPNPGLGREAAHARVILKDGRVLEAQVTHCRGSIGRPMTDGELSEKALAQLQTVYPEADAQRIVSECWRVAAYRRVDELCAMLASGRAASA